MFCKKCGKQLQDDSVFCSFCGTNQGEGDAPIEPKTDWRDVWESAFERASAKFSNGKEGQGTKVIGNSITISAEYYSGIVDGLKALSDAIEKIFPILKTLTDCDEIREAIDIVDNDVFTLCNSISDKNDDEKRRMRNELEIFWKNAESPYNNWSRAMDKSNAQYDANDKTVRALRSRSNSQIDELKAIIAEKYWQEHPDERQSLDTELGEIEKQLAALNEQINAIETKSNAYLKIVEYRKMIEENTAKKENLGLFKIKEKKELQAKIDQLSAACDSIQAKIDEAVAQVKQKTKPLEEKAAKIKKEIASPTKK